MAALVNETAAAALRLAAADPGQEHAESQKPFSDWFKAIHGLFWQR